MKKPSTVPLSVWDLPGMYLDRVWSRFAPRERVAFTGLLLLHVGLLWVVTYLPTQDGPSHLNNTNVILKYFRPEYPVFREYYFLNTGMWSNWLGHGILAGLISLFPLLVAEKVFVSGYVILFPLSARYALRGIRPEAGVFSFLSFPLIYNYNFNMGFYSFCYSLGFFFLLIGYWLRCRDRIGIRSWMMMASIAMLLYLFHIVSFLMACLFIGILSLAEMVSSRRCLPSSVLSPTWGAWDIFRFRALPTATALLPALSLAVLFVLVQEGGRSGIPGGGNPLFFPIYLFKKFMGLASFRVWESWIYGAFGAWVLWMAIRNRPKKNTIASWGGFSFLILACLLVLYVTPYKMSGAEELTPRLILYLMASIFFWLGLHVQRDGEKMAIVIVSIAISLGLLISHGVKYQELNKYFEEYESGADRIEMNSTLLPICFSPKGIFEENTFHSFPRTGPFMHASGYIAARRHVVEFTNYEANMLFFPTRFRAGLDPYVHIGDSESMDKPIDFLSYPARTGGRVDYVLVWGRNRGGYPPKVVASIAEQIREGYELIFTSERGSMMLYRRKNWLAGDR
jgi:hypothetical protein